MVTFLQAGIPAAVADTAVKVSKDFQKLDSTHAALKDSLQNMSATDVVQTITGQNTLFKDALGTLMDLALGFVPKLIGAAIVLWIGWKLAKVLKKALIRLLEKRNADAGLRTFISSFIDILLKIMLVIMVMDIIGIKATSFIAILGAFGLAIGMAMQGTLQNLPVE